MSENEEPVQDTENKIYSESVAPTSSGRRAILIGIAVSYAGVTASALARKNIPDSSLHLASRLTGIDRNRGARVR